MSRHARDLLLFGLGALICGPVIDLIGLRYFGRDTFDR